MTLEAAPLSFGMTDAVSKSETRSLARAALAIGRLDEHLRLHPLPASLQAWFFRTEALGVGRMEDLMSDKLRLVSLIADVGFEISNKADRTALDVHKAIELTTTWSGIAPMGLQLVEAWRLADKSNTRRKTLQFEWDLEQACEKTCQELASLLENPDPWLGAEAVRRTWVSGGLAGHARRVAMILAPFIVRRAFRSRYALAGVTGVLTRDPQATASALERSEDWAPFFFTAVAESAEKTFDASVQLLNIRNDLLRSCEDIRATRARRAVIDYALVLPILRPAPVAAALDITTRGAQILLDDLTELGCFTPLDPQDPKARVYACPKVLST